MHTNSLDRRIYGTIATLLILVAVTAAFAAGLSGDAAGLIISALALVAAGLLIWEAIAGK